MLGRAVLDSMGVGSGGTFPPKKQKGGIVSISPRIWPRIKNFNLMQDIKGLIKFDLIR